MCSRLDSYRHAFASLRTDKNRKRWSHTTCHQAPHKPFLLLATLDLIAAGSINRNFIEPSFELAETFARYWAKVMPLGSSASMAYPFYHLHTSGFWCLANRPELPHEKGRTISSVKRLREFYLGTRFEKDLYPLLVMETCREKLRHTLITTFFAPEVRPILTEQAIVNKSASLYSKELLMSAEPRPHYISAKPEIPEAIKGKARSQGFRKAIVNLYEHRCALCGIRMLTPEGHTLVEAAHIVPWSKSHNDQPQNGMALCRLCHWSFDKGLMGVGKEYEVLISRAVRQDNNFPGHMETLSGRGIFRPKQSQFWPDQENLADHRKMIFRSKP